MTGLENPSREKKEGLGQFSMGHKAFGDRVGIHNSPGPPLGKGCSLGGTTESHGYHTLPRYAPPVGHSSQVAVRTDCLYFLIEAQ